MIRAVPSQIVRAVVLCLVARPDCTGQIILAADGSLSLKVKSCGSDHVITEVLQQYVMTQSGHAVDPLQSTRDTRETSNS